ncbi:hypothetical protein PUN28_004592 [Cardiocondyla obscurior]|uniref:Secreted protein n=1 Tax=Cardiocondyla obscurior TaxID=286306 RepID=A0AAW2GDC3_9HYME
MFFLREKKKHFYFNFCCILLLFQTSITSLTYFVSFKNNGISTCVAWVLQTKFQLLNYYEHISLSETRLLNIFILTGGKIYSM